MDFQVVLSPRAIKDLEAIVRYIAWDNPEAAERFGRLLIEQREV
jgi:toxin ParE1/3/4